MRCITLNEILKNFDKSTIVLLPASRLELKIIFQSFKTRSYSNLEAQYIDGYGIRIQNCKIQGISSIEWYEEQGLETYKFVVNPNAYKTINDGEAVIVLPAPRLQDWAWSYNKAIVTKYNKAVHGVMDSYFIPYSENAFLV